MSRFRLRDHDQAWRNFFAGTHRRPTWRRRGRHEGFRIVGSQALRVRQDNRRWSSVLVPKVGWVKLKGSRALPEWKSYRVRRDRAGRWHIAFAAVALSTGELSSPVGLRSKEAERRLRLQRRLARQRKGSVTRLEQKAPGRVEKIPAAYSSQRCNACGQVAVGSRESQARFLCVACGHLAHADVNAARNIADGNPAAGRAVAARGDRVTSARSVKREPQRNRPPKVA